MSRCGSSSRVRRAFSPGVTALWLLIVLVFHSDSGVAITGLFFFIFGGAGLGLLLTIRLQLFVHATRRVGVDRRWTTWFAAAACLILAVVAASWPAPRNPLFVLRFRASEAALTAQALEMTASPTAQRRAPGRVGLFAIVRANAMDGQARFITSACGVVDSCGLVYAPSGSPRRSQEDHLSHIAGPWWHVYEGF